MGLFDFLFGKKNGDEAEAAPPSDSATPRMPGVEQWGDMDWPDRVRWLGAELEQVKAACNKAGIRTNPDLLKAELRGTYKGRPVAVAIDDDGAAELRVKFINRRGHLCLGAPIPGAGTSGQDDEFWSEDNDVVAPLVAPGVAFQANRQTIDQYQAAWGGLAPALQGRVVAGIQGGMSYVVVRHQEIETHIMVGPEYQVPVAATLIRCFDDLVGLADAFGEGEAGILPLGVSAAQAPEKKVCSYCDSTYYLDTSDPRCPACGANT